VNEVNKVDLKGVSLALIALSFFAVIIVAQVRAEEEYYVTAIIQSPEPFAGEQLGYMVTFNDGVLVVADNNAKIEGIGSGGKAYVCDLEGNIKITLQSPEPEVGGNFGFSMDVSGDVIVIGQIKGEKKVQMDVYVFNPEGSLMATLKSPTPMEQNTFGYAVAVDGDSVVVSDPTYTTEGLDRAGVVYVFDTGGILQTTIQSPRLGVNHNFGRDIAVSGRTIVIGEVVSAHSYGPVGPSRAYLFDVDGSLLATLHPQDPESAINFGNTVDVDGDIVAVGDSYAEVNGKIKAGRAYLYDREGNFLRTIQAPEPQEAAHFGTWVDISGDKIAIGEYKADVKTINEGRAYLFDTDGNLLATLQAPEPEVAAYFGWVVAVSGENVVVVARDAEVDGIPKAGKIYIFGPGTQPEAESKPEPMSEHEQEQPEEPKTKGIPGFPYESIILGLAAGAIVIWLIQPRR